MLVIAGDWKTAGHRLRKPAQGTAPAIGRRHSPCNRTEGMTPSNRTQGMTPCNQTQGMPPAIGHQARSPLSDANDDPTFVGNVQLQEKVHALGRLACRLPWHSTPLPSEGGAGGWVSPPNAKRVPTAQGLGNPRLLKGGGYLLSRIALQYHRRRRA